jgi:hypothetical protein
MASPLAEIATSSKKRASPSGANCRCIDPWSPRLIAGLCVRRDQRTWPIVKLSYSRRHRSLQYAKLGLASQASQALRAVVRRCSAEKPNHRHCRLLRVGSELPRARCRCAAKKRDELAPPHSITSSARASTLAGEIWAPRALAVFRFMTNSYFVGACTGRSAGFSPLRMRST